MDTMDEIDRIDFSSHTEVVKPWVPYEAAAILSVIIGALILIWPLRQEFSIPLIVFGSLIIAAGC
jgi:hypothetical protein